MINKDNFLLFGMRAYHNQLCKTVSEFEEDLGKFSNLSRLCSKEMDENNTKILLNSVVILFNLFEHSACISMMMYKVKSEDILKLQTVLVFLNRIPAEQIEGTLCQDMINILRSI